MRASRRDLFDLSRSAGGVLLATGVIVLLARQRGHGGTDELWRTLVLLVPAIVLYTLAVGAGEQGEPERGQPWRPVLLAASLVLAPEGLLELLRWLGADTGNSLYGAAVLAVTALLAGYASQRARVPYAALIAALAALIAWLFVWAQIVGDLSVPTLRWLLIAAAALLCIGAVALARRALLGANELVTIAGLAAVAAGAIGILVAYVQDIGGGNVASSSSDDAHVPITPFGHLHGAQSFGWDLFLLLVSLALILAAPRARSRGAGYVGAIGLSFFVLSVTARIAQAESGRPASGGVGGWAIALLALGAFGLLIPALRSRED